MTTHSQSDPSRVKAAVDIVAVIGSYLNLTQVGSNYRGLCPFHDDHNPSLIVSPSHQTFKCWSCGAGGDVFEFVRRYERVDFGEALRMVADRAGITLARSRSAGSPKPGGNAPASARPTVLAALEWAASWFAETLTLGRTAGADQAAAYLEQRGITSASVARFTLGYASEERDELIRAARLAGFSLDTLEAAGLVGRSAENPKLVRERFRGRLIFPIHDGLGRVIAFGGRLLPDQERRLKEAGRSAAKYLNSPETIVFSKRRVLYGEHLARAAARVRNAVVVVEGYTDVIAAHQVGLTHVVGTLGTALGTEHLGPLRRLADLVYLVFDGDEAGRNAADRTLELFLSHDLDVRVLTLEPGWDPCDLALSRGAAGFEEALGRAVDPLSLAIDRALERYGLNHAPISWSGETVEAGRRAAEAVVGLLARVPANARRQNGLKLARALDVLSHRLRIPLDDLREALNQARRTAKPRRALREQTAALESSRPVSRTVSTEEVGSTSGLPATGIEQFDVIDRELVTLALEHPASVLPWLSRRVPVSSLRDAPLRTILQACYDQLADGGFLEPETASCSSEREPGWSVLLDRLDEPHRAIARALLDPIDAGVLPPRVSPAPWQERLAGAMLRWSERDRLRQIDDLLAALAQVDPLASPEDVQGLRLELDRLSLQRSDLPVPGPREPRGRALDHPSQPRPRSPLGSPTEPDTTDPDV